MRACKGFLTVWFWSWDFTEREIWEAGSIFLHCLILPSEVELVSVSPNKIKTSRSPEQHPSAHCSAFASPWGSGESYCHSISHSCDTSHSVLLATLPRSPAALAIVPHSQYRCGLLFPSCSPHAVMGTERCPQGLCKVSQVFVAWFLCSSPSGCKVVEKQILRGGASDDASNRD